MNQLILLGNVGQDAEVHKFESNRFAIRFSLAVTKSWKDPQGVKQSKTDWFRCTRYANSDALAPYIKKGMKLIVMGEAGADAYIKDGEAVASPTCNVKEIQFVDSPSQNNSNTNSQQTENATYQTDNDLPF